MKQNQVAKNTCNSHSIFLSKNSLDYNKLEKGDDMIKEQASKDKRTSNPTYSSTFFEIPNTEAEQSVVIRERIEK